MNQKQREKRQKSLDLIMNVLEKPKPKLKVLETPKLREKRAIITGKFLTPI